MGLSVLRPRALAAVLALIPLTSSLALAAPQVPGGLIGDPDGRSGKWPLVRAPLGNPFETTAPNDYVPTPGSYTESKARLGKALFWDEQVSTDNTMACGTCHLPEMAGLDPRGPGLATNNGHGSLAHGGRLGSAEPLHHDCAGLHDGLPPAPSAPAS
jgi:hypothetical protein